MVTRRAAQASRMRRVLLAVIEYLLGFLALAFFAFLAFDSPNVSSP